ncbi:hypothetical protein P8452_60244 [Trifolium repens]|nr:hypothetical protein P8452_60244 [Trifolium repens]
MASINFTIDSVSVLNPKLNHYHHHTRLSLPHSPTFHPLLKHNGTFNRRKPLTVTFVAPQHDSEDHGEVEVEKKKGNDVDLEVDWSEIVEPLQELRELLQELSNKIITKMMDNFDLIMKEINEEPDLTFMAKEITEEGKKYFSSAIETSPEVKEIVDTFTSPDDDELNNVSSVQDFYVGIPYGLILSLGGFLSFMITGSIAAIRFGVILGGVLLALSISSLKSYKKGQPSSLALKGGQIAIVSILFLREISSVGRGSTYITALISGAVAAFYVYRLVLEGKTQKGSNLEGEAGN